MSANAVALKISAKIELQVAVDFAIFVSFIYFHKDNKKKS
jgi:hypothetical protein